MTTAASAFPSPREGGEKVPSASEADEGLPRATRDAAAVEAPRSPSSALRAPSPRLRGEKDKRSIIPWLFPMGLGLVIAVNMVLLFFALRSFPGLVVKNAYERGRGYGAEIERSEAQDALGWSLDVRHDGAAGRVVVRIADAAGREIPGLLVSAIADRPVGKLVTVDVPLSASGDARYAGAFAPQARGAWDITVSARDSAGRELRATRRVIVR